MQHGKVQRAEDFGPAVFACAWLICSFARMGRKQQCFQYHCGETRRKAFEAVQTVMEKNTMLNNVLKACVERFEQHQDVGLSLLKRIADPIKAVRLVYLHPPSLKA